MLDLRLVSLPARAERPETVDLSVTVGTLHLSNPIIAASGTFGYGVEFAQIVDLNRLGALVVKGLSAEPMAGAPAPRLCETASGMVNAVGLQNIGVKAFVAEKLPILRRFKPLIVTNIFGHKVQEYVEVIRVLEDAEGVGSYELNISCPNVEKGGAEFSSDPKLTAQVVDAARKVARRPLWVKLAPNLPDIKSFAVAVEDSGGDAVTVANTYPAICIDFRTRKAVLGNKTGGLSGPAIKPITLRLVYEVSQAVQIPVIGLGGIGRPEDVLEYIIAGAAAVQVGTAHFVDPTASERLVEGLEKLCKSSKIYSISKLRGSLGKEIY